MSNPTSPTVSPTKEISQEIKAINKETVHRICSGQVVLNLATAIKELVENSLDAGATVVEIRLKEYGSEFIEVSDNGSGVQEENFEGLTLKHHTSKLQEFSDLVDVETFGFRGEALSSLCALSEMTVTTRHASSVTGTKMVYDSNGHIKSKSPCARQIGTTVSLANLFSTLPVRQKEFLRNLKREFVKMTHLLYGYCLIASHVRFVCVNQTKKGSRSVVVTTQGNGSLKDNISCIFGPKQVVGLLELKQEKPSKEYLEEQGITKDISDLFRLDGWISSCAHGQGRSSADRQFYYINNRPCELAKVSKVVNEIYHQFNVHQFPFVFLNITTDRSGVDVNVTPDKRQIFLENEKILLASVKATVLKLYETIPSTFQMQNVNPLLQRPTRKEETQSSTMGSDSNGCKSSGLSALLRNFSHGSPKSPTTESRFANCHLNSSPLGRGTKRVIEVEKDRDGKRQMSLASFIKTNSSTNGEESLSSIVTRKEDESERQNQFEEEMTMDNDPTADINSTAVCDVEDDVIENEVMDVSASVDSTPRNFDSLQRVKVNIEGVGPASNFTSEITRISANSKSRLESTNVKKHTELERRTESIEEERTGAEESTEIERSTKSGEGDKMTEWREVERRIESTKVENGTECTGVNPRCADETETRVCENNVIICDEDDGSIGHGRRAVRLQADINEISRRLHRRRDRLERKQDDISKPIVKFYAEIDPSSNKSAEQELSREISKDMFAKMAIVGQFNLGFIVTLLGNDLFIVDQHATDEKYNFETLQHTTVIQNQKLVIPQTLDLTQVNEGLLLDNIEIFQKNGFDFKFDENGPPTRRVQLTAKPYSQNWEFGREDVDELLFMLSDTPHMMCRPSRVRAMFASRACRKSVMIGTALSKADMRRLINHMGEIEQPWNCPHGRPTMRHLINLEMVRKK